MTNISFGTDGFRGILNKDFNKDNVKIIIKACAKYILETYGEDKKIIIGFDPRNQAEEYAHITAKLLLEFGFDVCTSKKIIPTPMVAFAAKYYNACAFMYTASHNPPEYLGVKFIPDFGGPATSEITNKITGYFENNDFSVIRNGNKIDLNLEKPYFEHLKKLININEIKKVKSNIIFDGLYSSTIGYFDKFLEENKISFEKINCYHDINFGGNMPDPKPKYLKTLIEKIKNQPNSVGMANDGDGDRYGVINENGEYVTPNEIMGILLIHLIKNKNTKGDLAITVAGSSMLKVLAKKLDVKVIETPVGFKWLGEAMRNNNVILAGEDSGGLSIGSHIPEKDGIIANLLILEAMGYEKKSLAELQKELYDFVGTKFEQDRLDYKFDNKEEMRSVIENISKINKFPYKIVDINKIDGLKISFENESWILVRPSGTEPLLRVYFEAQPQDLEDLKTFVDTKIKFFL